LPLTKLLTPDRPGEHRHGARKGDDAHART